MERCADCKYFKDEGPPFPTKGECRRFPPVDISWLKTTDGFPVVKPESWCGEFKRVEADRED